MTSRVAILIAVTLCAAFADQLTTRDGKVIEGTYLGGDSRQIRMAVGDNIETFSVSDVQSVQFGGTLAAKKAAVVTQPAEPAAPAAPSPAAAPAPMAAPAPEAAPEPAKAAEATDSTAAADIPAGTEIVIRMIDDVDSETSRVGQTFKASLDEPIVVNSKTVVPRNVDVTAKLVEDQQSGKLTGRTELTLALVDITIDGKQVPVITQEVTQASESRTGRTAKVVGGTAALGAIIGAIAGGGKGAAVGATTGAGAGAAVQVLTKGQRVRIPSETRLTFTLKNPVRL
ncbi:MAG: hypothetical protein ABFD89_26525 [Bryobacteraceae bacterium]